MDEPKAYSPERARVNA